MKTKTTLSLIVTALLVTAYFGLPKYAQNHVKKELSNLGYKKTTIGKTNIGLNTATFRDITLKKGQTIKKIIISGTPLSFIGLSDIKLIEVYGLNIESPSAPLLTNLKENEGIFFKGLLPAKKIRIKDSVVHFPLAEHKITIAIAGALTHNNINKTKIEGNISSLDTMLSFNTALEGHFDNKGNGAVDITVNTLNLNHKLTSLHRATGWINFSQSENKAPKISGQIDAGSGDILSVPAKNINVVLGEENKNDVLILRAQAAGVEGTDLLTDISYGGSNSDLNMQTTLNLEDTNAFINYLENLKKPSKTIPSFKNMGKANITINYLPERRFIDGPLPFDLTAKSGNKEIMNGTFLIYPKDMEIRGNAQTNKEYTNDIKRLFSISEEKISGETLRLDGSLSGLF